MKQRRKRPRLLKEYAKVDIDAVKTDIDDRARRLKEHFSYKKEYLSSLGYTILSNRLTSSSDPDNRVINNKNVNKFFRIEQLFAQKKAFSGQ